VCWAPERDPLRGSRSSRRVQRAGRSWRERGHRGSTRGRGALLRGCFGAWAGGNLRVAILASRTANGGTRCFVVGRAVQSPTSPWGNPAQRCCSLDAERAVGRRSDRRRTAPPSLREPRRLHVRGGQRQIQGGNCVRPCAPRFTLVAGSVGAWVCVWTFGLRLTMVVSKPGLVVYQLGDIPPTGPVG
jgi:hypothetical protein